MPAWKWAAFLLRPLVTSLERGSREGVAKTSRGGDRWNGDFGGKGGERQGSRAEMTNYPKTEGGSSPPFRLQERRCGSEWGVFAVSIARFWGELPTHDLCALPGVEVTEQGQSDSCVLYGASLEPRTPGL